MEETKAVHNIIKPDTIEKIKTRDAAALEKVMEHYGDRLLRAAYMYLKDEHLARDIVQKVFIKLYYKIDQFKEKSSLYTWLYRITINECKSSLRKWSFRKIFYTDSITEISDRQSETPGDNPPERTIIENEKNRGIYELITGLKTKYRMVIILYYYHELSVREMASILEEKEDTIKTRLFRARQKLKELLINKGGILSG